ncbi:MAG: type IX secretion system sortase PorU, partial [Bacteroidota bacterium]
MKTSTQFRKKLILSTSLLLVFVGLFANSPYTIKQTLQWSEGLLVDNPEAPNPYRYYHFAGAVYQVEHLSLPYFTTQFEVPGRGSLGYEIVRANYEPFDKVASPDDAVIGEALEVSTRVEKSRQQYLGTLTFLPIRRRGKRFERLVSFELKVVFRPAEPRGGSRNDFTFTSELSEGDIYKMAVNRSGLHRIDYTFLKDELNIDIDNVDPRTLKILGNSGGPLPLANAVARHDDLEENAILVVGENDGRFNEGDYILFYAQGPHRWDYNSSKARFDRETNVFDDKKYYFLKISAGNGKRVGTQASLPNTEYTTTSFNDYRRLEDEFINLLFEMSGAQGSGRSWYGDLFSQERQRSYDFNFPFLDTNSPVNVTTVLIGRHNLQTRFTVTANSNQTFESNSIRQSPLDKVDSDFANSGSIDGNFTSNGDGINILVNYPAVGDGTNRGWLDYIQLNARRKLNMVSEPLAFRDAQTLDYASSTFELSNVDAEVEIWDITNGQNPLVQSFDRTNDLLRFGVTTNEVIREFVAFRRSNSFPSPERVGKIANQNIHSIDNVDMVIIYHPNFASQAEQLAQHRRTHSNLDIATVAIGDIYNEFSSGGIDPTAIRDFARMLYLRNSDFHYMLLFGDASFDYKNKYGAGGNFVPTFETLYSLNALSAYPTDDYYSYLDEDEGDPLGRGRDIAVGRLPARSATEAQGLVNKIIHYDTNSDCLGDWRNRLIFVADDEDNNIHLRDTDSTAEVLDDEEPDFNQSKIYLDAFFQESTPGGARIPQAQESLNRDMFRGTLAINYLGHGGSSGWAQERVLRQSDISSWENYDRLPLFITATCSFAGFDEPDLNTAGELAITRPDGGAIALFTTVRAVFAQQNKRLTDSVFDFLLKGGALDSPSRTIGEILRIAKDNAQASADNTLKFTLLGDPSMKLALPRYRVATTHINGVAVEGNPQDTIGALEKVTVRGLVTDDNGNVLEQFNGRIFPT